MRTLDYIRLTLLVVFLAIFIGMCIKAIKPMQRAQATDWPIWCDSTEQHDGQQITLIYRCK